MRASLESSVKIRSGRGGGLEAIRVACSSRRETRRSVSQGYCVSVRIIGSEVERSIEQVKREIIEECLDLPLMVMVEFEMERVGELGERWNAFFM